MATMVLTLMSIQSARVCLRNSFVVFLNPYFLLLQSVNVTLMAQLVRNVMTGVLVFAVRDSTEPNAMTVC